MNNDIYKKLSNFISENILKQPNRVISVDTPLLSGGLIDSFNLVDLALYVEEEFGVHLDDSELNSSFFDTLNQLMGIIELRS